MEYETLTKEEMERVLKGEKLDKLESTASAPLKLPEPLQAAPGFTTTSPSPGPTSSGTDSAADGA